VSAIKKRLTPYYFSFLMDGCYQFMVYGGNLSAKERALTRMEVKPV